MKNSICSYLSITLFTLSFILQLAAKPFLSYLALYFGCVLLGWVLFTGEKKYTLSINLIFSALYILVLIQLRSLFRSSCHLYLYLILTGLYLNIWICCALPSLSDRSRYVLSFSWLLDVLRR